MATSIIQLRGTVKAAACKQIPWAVQAPSDPLSTERCPEDGRRRSENCRYLRKPPRFTSIRAREVALRLWLPISWRFGCRKPRRSGSSSEFLV